MRLKLIAPRNAQNPGVSSKWGAGFMSVMTGVDRYNAITTALPTLAGLTPRSFAVSLHDENVEAIDFDEHVDCVGITAYTATIQRAFEIADEFRKRNVTVILGGIHVTCFPEEALCHADAVVIGEAEGVWPRLLKDFQKGSLRQRYVNLKKPNLRSLPMPRYDLVPHHRYNYHHIQTARGCVFNCEYCTAPSLFGRTLRRKSIRQIVKELKCLQSCSHKMIHFCDDVFIIDRRRSLRLLKAIKPLRVTFNAQGSMGMQDDDELLDQLVASGCNGLSVGFETINQRNLSQCRKGSSYVVDDYMRFVEQVQAKGLMVNGFFIFGFDEDEIAVFEDTVDFIKRSGMAQCGLSILTPLPHTDLYTRLQAEGRLLDTEWSSYDLHHVCFKPKHMTAEELQNGYYWAMKEVFDLQASFNRAERVYKTWNQYACNVKDRMGPLLSNLSAHYVSAALPTVMHPQEFRNSLTKEG